jgi:hypothetical protein
MLTKAVLPATLLVLPELPAPAQQQTKEAAVLLNMQPLLGKTWHLP